MKKWNSLTWQAETFGEIYAPNMQHERIQEIAQTSKACADTLRNLYELREKLYADSTRSKESSDLHLRAHAKKAFNNFVEMTATAQASVATELTNIANAQTNWRAPKSKVGEETRRAHIRGALKAMERVERDTIIRKAIMQGDYEVLDAIASAKIFESGANPLAYQDAQNAFDEINMPDRMKLKGELSAGLQHLESVTRTLQDVISSEFIRPTDGLEAAKQAANSALNGEGANAKAL